MSTSPRLFSSLALSLSLGLGLMTSAAQAGDDANKPSKSFRAGMDISEQADLKDIGLPAYPGARIHRDKKDDKKEDNGNATIGFSFGPFGMKLVVSKFASNDELEQVSRYYREALSNYGTVLDCSPGSPAALEAKARKSRKEKDPNGCGEVSGDGDERVYKVGTEKNFRLVSLKTVGREVQFQLMKLELRGL